MKLLEELLNSFEKHSGKIPHAFLCNKKTYEQLLLELEKSNISVQINLKDQKYIKGKIPKQISFKDIPIFKCQDLPDNEILAVDEETSVRIIEEEKPLWRDYL